MGERGSIQVCDHGGKTPDLLAVTLFRHWGGSEEDMKALAERAYAIVWGNLNERNAAHREVDPYGRGEVGSVLALLTQLAVMGEGYSAYLGREVNEEVAP